MSTSNLDFSIPSRQSPIAILFIAIKFLRRMVRAFWPMILVVALGSKKDWTFYLLFVVMAITIGQMVLSLLAYFKYLYYVEEDELIIEKGIIQKVKLNIPLDRIQTINFEQNLLHQVLQVVRVMIDTAGSVQNELTLDALSMERAEALRDFVIKQKEKLAEESPAGEVILAESEEEVVPIAEEQLLFQLEIRDLIRIGITQNHLRTAGVILAFFFGLLNQIEEAIDMEFQEMVERVVGVDVQRYGVMILISIPIFLLISFLITLVRTPIQFYDFRLFKTQRGFKTVAGLFNRREQSAVFTKIQLIRWSTNPLKQIFDLFSVRLSQASSVQMGRKKSISIPGCYPHQVEMIRSHLIPDAIMEGMKSYGINPAIISRHVLYLGVIPAVVLVPATFSFMGYAALCWLALIPGVYLLSRRYQRRWKYSLNGQLLMTHSGVIGSRFTLLQLFKIQAVEISQTPFQRRKALASIEIFTAAGGVDIPYISLEMAHRLRDYFLFKVESDQRKWM